MLRVSMKRRRKKRTNVLLKVVETSERCGDGLANQLALTTPMSSLVGQRLHGVTSYSGRLHSSIAKSPPADRWSCWRMEIVCRQVTVAAYLVIKQFAFVPRKARFCPPSHGRSTDGSVDKHHPGGADLGNRASSHPEALPHCPVPGPFTKQVTCHI